MTSNCLCSREPREILPVPDPQCRSRAVAVPGLGDWTATGSATSGTSWGQIPRHCSGRTFTPQWFRRWYQWDRCRHWSDCRNTSGSTSSVGTLSFWKCCWGGSVRQWSLRNSEAWSAGPGHRSPPKSEQRWKQSVLLWLTRTVWRSSGATATSPCTICPWPIK